MKININLVIISVLFFVSCEEIELKTVENNVPVVESYLSPNMDLSIKIKKQLIFNSEDTSATDINDLELEISDGQNSYLLQSIGEGKYINSDIVIQENVEYKLLFEYNQKIVSADTYIPTKPLNFTSSSTSIVGTVERGAEIDFITFYWSNNSSSYHMVVVENLEQDPVLINSSNTKFSRTFRSAPTLGNASELKAFNFSYYGLHRVILYKLNPEYASLYEQLGTNSLDITAPPSNVKNGLGIFTGINSDTLFISVISQ